MSKAPDKPAEDTRPPRRTLLSKASGLAMLAGLAGGYGAFAAIAARFLYPSKPRETRWLFVTEVARIASGETILYEAPGGERINVTRRAATGGADDFIALSSTCPHLGCRVHWESQNHRYFCPCHNGVFDPAGKATAGPPAEAGQSLSRFEVKVDSGLLLMQVPIETLAQAEGEGRIIETADDIRGPGHDPCLALATRRSAGDDGERRA